ncbi:patatin-like phospholipase family protein [Aquimarina latercula]|uniref:patatin-like phospholipase family protein n=1 Tax=Aquimarina latercula TaxID=987 RepID=UPI0003FE88A7|nr:patatin-like phospholipase family protein [Aquimarina latercula]
MKQQKIGISLSGGGARGAAHIGVLQALNENGIVPAMVSGSSAGAIIGALYCSGYSPLEILELCRDHTFLKIFRIGFINKGLTELTYLKEFLEKTLKAKTFEDLHIPLKVGVTNINKGAFEIKESGDLIKSVVASSAIPLIFKPVKIGNDIYVDGGVMNNLPIEPLQDHCHKIIGVSVCPHKFNSRVEGIKDIGVRTFHLAVWNTMEHRLDQCDVVLEIEKSFSYGLFDLKQSPELFQAGYETTLQQISSIKDTLSKTQK